MTREDISQFYKENESIFRMLHSRLNVKVSFEEYVNGLISLACVEELLAPGSYRFVGTLQKKLIQDEKRKRICFITSIVLNVALILNALKPTEP
jgi:hypothetical protein